MTIRELIDELEYFDENTEVVMQGVNSMYVDSISHATTKELRANWGKDREVVVLVAEDQEGAV